MKAEDMGWRWDFEPALTDISEIQCHECEEWSPCAEWTEGSVYCEDCGEHSAIVCPRCEEAHDHVWCKPFKTREAV